jgi:hypothetical protein
VKRKKVLEGVERRSKGFEMENERRYGFERLERATRVGELKEWLGGQEGCIEMKKAWVARQGVLVRIDFMDLLLQSHGLARSRIEGQIKAEDAVSDGASRYLVVCAVYVTWGSDVSADCAW